MSQTKTIGIIAAVITILIMAMAANTSSSGDEATQVTIGNNILKFYQTGGEDTTALKPRGLDQFQYYGSSFDTFCQFVVQTFQIKDQYQFRHLMNGLIGGLIILFIGLFGRLIKNDTVGIVAMILALCSPRLLGHSFNNPKDIPFALGYLMSIYFMSKWFLDFERNDKKTIILLIMSIAYTSSIRIGGIMLYGYLGLFIFLHILTGKGIRNLFFYKKQILTSLFVVVVSYFLGLLLWPFGLVSPLKNPFEALAGFEKVGLGISQLFGGNYMDSSTLPQSYLTTYILITTPVIILLGFLFFLFRQFLDVTWRKNMIHYLLLFAVVFPLLYIVYKNSNVYGGWRQVLFVYPPMVILSALGIVSFYERFIEKYVPTKWLIYPIIALTLAHPIRHIIVNHPYAYIYFNEALGGVSKAYGKYEMDYYYHSTKEATLWLRDYIKKNHPDPADTILTASNHGDYSYYLRDEPNIKSTYALYYYRYAKDWDYYVCINAHMHPYQLQNKYWPPAGTIHTINIDGQPICAVIKRPSKDDLKGNETFMQNQFSESIRYYKSYLSKDPTDCAVLAALANSYIGINAFDSCWYYANESLKYFKNFSVALDMIGRVHISNKNYEKAIDTYNLIIKEKPNFYLAYYFLSYIYLEKKDYFLAIKNAELCLYQKRDFKPMYQIVGQIKQAQGYESEAQKYFQMAK
ncbi:MAG: hypothetical protein IPM42_06785 [Saprospiraceae bacterium]|nr:hypothetical protein [Saprospiraceae bacterium]